VAGDVFDLTERARRYISKIVSVAGEGGHNAAFRAACKLREFGLPMEAAWPLLLAWNDMNATPPWTPKELRHKLEDAYERR
jgi:hypothetical protein